MNLHERVDGMLQLARDAVLDADADLGKASRIRNANPDLGEVEPYVEPGREPGGLPDTRRNLSLRVLSAHKAKASAIADHARQFAFQQSAVLTSAESNTLTAAHDLAVALGNATDRAAVRALATTIPDTI